MYCPLLLGVIGDFRGCYNNLRMKFIAFMTYDIIDQD